MENFLVMDGYGIYVWPSFIIAALLLIGLVLVSLRSLRRAQKALAQLQELPTTAKNET